MPEVPKIVHLRLRAGLPGSIPAAAHPDPDVLTAFAEHSLSAAEREGVLQHLARCGDCRELMALSLPPLESTPQAAAEATVPEADTAHGRMGGQRSWFAWPGLRWAALAAGIAVAGGILLIHPGKPSAVPEAKQQPAVTVAQPDRTMVAKDVVPAASSAPNATHSEKKPALAEPVISRDSESQARYFSARPAEKGMARGQIGLRDATKNLAAGTAPASPAPAPPARASSEAVEVTGAEVATSTDATRSDLAVSELGAAAPMSISKAKAAKTESNEAPALQRSESIDKKQATDATAQRQRADVGMKMAVDNLSPNGNRANLPRPEEHSTQWAIHGNDLQLSLDSGAVWKTVLHSDQPLLCYAAGGNDIWVGGKGRTLFHSSDGGVSWNHVHPSIQEQTLPDDVVRIVISPSQVILFIGNNRSWSTPDGGKTWEKK